MTAEQPESIDQRAPISQPKLKGKNLEVALRAIIDPIIAAAELDLIEFRMLRSPRGGLRIQLYVDRFAGQGGVLVDDCASVSRKIGAVLEIEDPIAGAYDLEVSSPGMKRLLRHMDDTRRFGGFRARLTLPEQPDAPRRTLIGALVEPSEDDAVVSLRLDSGAIERIPFADVQRAVLDPTLDQWLEIGARQLAEREQRADQTSALQTSTAQTSTAQTSTAQTSTLQATHGHPSTNDAGDDAPRAN